MKKLTFILVLAMLALLTQCKKEDPTQDNPSDGIQMILKANNGGSKTSFGPDGAISWSANDVIYVVAGGQCVGSVTNGAGGGSTFTGTLSGITTSGTYDFHYYYVGNQTIANNATSFTMNFTNQEGTLAHLGDFHVGHGVQSGVEVTTGTPVTAQTNMSSLVSMAYFNTSCMAETDDKVFFYGDNINNQLSIDFSTNTPTYNKVNSGWICAGTASTGAYVMLLPNHTDGTEELDTDITFVSKRTTGTCNGVFNYGIVPGRFYCAGGNTNNPISVSATSYYPGALRGVFSISATETVHLSQGNLQYIGSDATPYWKFADHQWESLGGTTGQFSDATNVDRDLFGWGTGNNPNLVSTNNADYATYTDWGTNAIANGGNTANMWHSLYCAQWRYILQTRAASTIGGTSNARMTMAYLFGTIHGAILFPDDYTHPAGIAVPVGINCTSYFDQGFKDSWGGNRYTAEEWAQMEAAGAVFLPTTDNRSGTSMSNAVLIGFYWTPTIFDEAKAFSLAFSGNGGIDAGNSYGYRYTGHAARLVR